MSRRITYRIALLSFVLLVTLVTGTIGFRVIEGYSFFDAFYMTLITITTVGYQELHPLSLAGRIFNSFLILFGVSAMFFAVGAMTQTIIELELQGRLEKRKRRRQIMRLNDHFIVCGFGRVGRNACDELKRANVPFLIIDRDEHRIDRATQAGMLATCADVTSDETLRAAGIARARGFIAALATDADNVFVILSAKSLNPHLMVVTRAAEEDAEEKLKRAGADRVLSPYAIAGHRLAQAVLRPRTVQLLDLANSSLDLDITMEQVPIGTQALLSSRKLRDVLGRNARGVIVLALRTADGKTLFNPPPETEISSGDALIVMGAQTNLREFEDLLAIGR